MKSQRATLVTYIVALCFAAFTLGACASCQQQASSGASASSSNAQLSSSASNSTSSSISLVDKARSLNSQSESASPSSSAAPNANALRAQLNIDEYLHSELDHGDKSAPYQKYIVLHDTEGSGNGHSVVDGWIGDGNYVASHFIVNKDGSIVQAVPIDRIAHHAGFGDTGHNNQFGTVDESRDDKRGTSPIGSWASDYGMNSYSVGIEMVHEGNNEYPEAQLVALDSLIAYIDAHYGFESTIIDHKMWRSGNSDTSDAFAGYLANYRNHRTHL